MITWKETHQLIFEDLKRFGPRRTGSVKQGIYRIFISHSFRITFWYRIGYYCIHTSNPIAKLVYPIVWAIHTHNQYLTGIQLPFSVVAKGGLLFPHFSGIIIHPQAQIGSLCTIHQCVTIGTERHKSLGGKVIIGDRCVLSTGAKIIGPLTIGNDVIVGANAVVTKDVVDGSVMVGIPARELNRNGKEYCLLRHQLL